MENKHAHCLAAIQAEAWAARTLLVRIFAKLYDADPETVDERAQKSIDQNTARFKEWLLEQGPDTALLSGRRSSKKEVLPTAKKLIIQTTRK